MEFSNDELKNILVLIDIAWKSGSVRGENEGGALVSLKKKINETLKS